MNNPISQKIRRVLVIANYFSLILLISMFHIGEQNQMSIPIIVLIGLGVISAGVTFFYAHIKTRLWKLVHTKTDNLDEREISITRESLQYSYSWFTVISLIFIMYLVYFNQESHPVLLLIFAGMLYFAHTLPSTILAWKEKDIR